MSTGWRLPGFSPGVFGINCHPDGLVSLNQVAQVKNFVMAETTKPEPEPESPEIEAARKQAEEAGRACSRADDEWKYSDPTATAPVGLLQTALAVAEADRHYVMSRAKEASLWGNGERARDYETKGDELLGCIEAYRAALEKLK